MQGPDLISLQRKVPILTHRSDPGPFPEDSILKCKGPDHPAKTLQSPTAGLPSPWRKRDTDSQRISTRFISRDKPPAPCRERKPHHHHRGKGNHPPTHTPNTGMGPSYHTQGRESLPNGRRHPILPTPRREDSPVKTGLRLHRVRE